MTNSTEETVPRRVVLYLRQHASADTVQGLRQTVSRVRRLEADEVADVEVKTWGAVNPVLEELSDSGPSVSLTVKSFQAWADREGYTLQPAFTRRETTSLLSSRPEMEIQVPVACLAVYEGEDLQCVAPCSDGEQTYSVEECLAALEAGFTDPFAFRDQVELVSGESADEEPL